MNRYSLADIEYEHVRQRCARLIDERQDTLSSIEDSFGLDSDQSAEKAFLASLKRTAPYLYTDRHKAYLYGLIEAEDEIIESSYT
mgnify:CR=1 FL=1